MKNNQISNDLKSYFESNFRLFIEKHYPEGSSLLNNAISYALRGEGKRVRPLLTLLVNYALGGNKESALPAAFAVEMMHTYSLVHDDMPILDNDDLRRGRKTVHVVFDQPTALLAGNSILTDLFSVISKPTGSLSSEQKNLMIAELVEASGSKGMANGQILDLYWAQKQGYTKTDLDEIHLNKTGKLLGCSCALGALSVSSDFKTKESFQRFGELIGLSFQIIDDLLDVSTETGKSAGKDENRAS